MARTDNLIVDHVDRISSLPNDLLHHIVSFLSTLDAIRTCILSKRWKNIWINLPKLAFNLSEFESNTESKRSACKRFEDFVSMTLLHRGAINVHEVHLSVSDNRDDDWDICLIKNCICNVIEHNPRVFHGEGIPTRSLPDDFTCLSLEDFCMDCSLIKTPNIITLPNLKRLQLKSTYVNEDGMRRLLRGCPLLETLHLEGCFSRISSICCNSLKYLQMEKYCTCYGSMPKTTINTPNFQSFKYKGNANYIGYTMLVSISPSYGGSIDLNICGYYQQHDERMDEITEQLSNVPKHKLSCIILKDFLQMDLPFFPRISELNS